MKRIGLTAEFYFPKTDNNGRDQQRALGEFQLRMLFEFGGYTDLGTARGVWKLDGRSYSDVNTIIAVSSDKLTLELIQELAEGIKKSTSQMAVYFKVDGKAYLTDNKREFCMKDNRFHIVQVHEGEPYGVILDTCMTRRVAEAVLFDLATPDHLIIIVDTDILG